MKTETRVYVVDLRYDDDFNTACSDETFMEVAEEQGGVYSLEGFERAFNDWQVITKQDQIRIITLS
jgi:hypothetical protein